MSDGQSMQARTNAMDREEHHDGQHKEKQQATPRTQVVALGRDDDNGRERLDVQVGCILRQLVEMLQRAHAQVTKEQERVRREQDRVRQEQERVRDCQDRECDLIQRIIELVEERAKSNARADKAEADATKAKERIAALEVRVKEAETQTAEARLRAIQAETQALRADRIDELQKSRLQLIDFVRIAHETTTLARKDMDAALGLAIKSMGLSQPSQLHMIRMLRNQRSGCQLLRRPKPVECTNLLSGRSVCRSCALKVSNTQERCGL